MIGSEFSLSYYKRSADPALPGDPRRIDVYKHLCMDEVSGLRHGCLRGDSGSGVFARGKNGLDFVGLLVNLYEEDMPPRRCGLVVPAGRVFAQIQEETGMEWEIAGDA